MKNNKKGFTIVELVIVIAVIAILAAVLIPTFTIVVKRAKDSNALSTAKNSLESVVGETATTTGLKDGSIFAVADKKLTAANHYIVYDSTKEEALAQAGTAKTDVTIPEADNTYVVFAKSIAAADATLDDILGADVTIDYYYNGTAGAAIAEGNASNYAAGTYFYNNTAVGGKTVHLFLNEDIAETCVVILA